MSAPCSPRNPRLPSFRNCRTESQAQARKWQTPNHPHFSAPLCSFASDCSPTGSSVHGIFFFPGKNTGVGLCTSFSRRIFPTQEWNSRLLYYRRILHAEPAMICTLNAPSANYTDFRPEKGRRAVRSQWEEGIQRLGKFFAPDTGLSLSQYQGPSFLKTRVQKFCKE